MPQLEHVETLPDVYLTVTRQSMPPYQIAPRVSRRLRAFPRGMFPETTSFARNIRAAIDNAVAGPYNAIVNPSRQPVLAPAGSNDIVGLSVYRRRSHAESTLIPHP